MSCGCRELRLRGISSLVSVSGSVLVLEAYATSDLPDFEII